MSFKTNIGSVAHVVVTPQTEITLAAERAMASAAARRAPRRSWMQLRDDRRDSYVRPGMSIDECHVAPSVDVDPDDGTVAFSQPTLPQGGIYTDGDGDKKLANGVRLAWYNEHRNGYQHGRVRNVGGNLVLMPAPKPVVEPTLEEAHAELVKMQRQIEALQKKMEAMRK